METLYGRVRWMPDIKSKNWNLRENARRMAINARIQGTAADLLKLAMIAIDCRLRDEHPDARLLLTVHDELVLEVPEEQVEAVAALVKKEMEGVAEPQRPPGGRGGVGEELVRGEGVVRAPIRREVRVDHRPVASRSGTGFPSCCRAASSHAACRDFDLGQSLPPESGQTPSTRPGRDIGDIAAVLFAMKNVDVVVLHESSRRLKL